jgi:leader peptidase (prepilin peptidase)/N-methyltransferase
MFLLDTPFIWAFLILIGVTLGSFVNVVIYRLPYVMGIETESKLTYCKTTAKQSICYLAYPPSRCPNCKHQLRWYENIPILSFFIQLGKCRACRQKINCLYPIIEGVSASLICLVFYRYIYTSLPYLDKNMVLTTIAWGGCLLVWSILFVFDWKYYVLPDVLTLPLVWLGMLVSSLGLNPGVNLTYSFWGVVVGYGFFWLVLNIFKKVTGKEGMGYGDLKLTAAIGAWLGWQVLPSLVIVASISGLLFGLLVRYKRLAYKRSLGLPKQAIAFGPHLILAAVLIWYIQPIDSILIF